MLVLEGYMVWEPRIGRRRSDSNVDGLGDLPGLKDDAHALAEEYHPRCTFSVVDKIEQDDCLHEDVGKNGTDGDADVILLVPPV